MKKTKLSLCLASSFVAALSLVACNSVSGKDGAVVTVTNYNGQTTPILTNAVYRKYKTETDGVSKFYNAILESLIRYEYADSASAIRTQNWTKAIKSNSEIKSEAENNVKNDKNTAEENAKTNNTSYETEWDAILSSHNCEDESELLEYYIYQLEKEDISDKFFLEQKDSKLLTEWIGVTDDGEDPEGEAKGVFPYHIRHVLVSLSGGSSNFYSGTITSAEAKNLMNTMSALLDSKYTFSDVAKKYSGDSGSGAKGGDVGIMSTTTSFVNEFKLGLYVYDSLYTNTADPAKDTIKKGLGIDNDYKLDLFGEDGGVGIEDAWTNDTYGINEGKVTEVPFGAFLKIGELADVEKNAEGKQVNDGDEHYFPRNVLYNYYLNYHNPFVITKKMVDDTNGLERDLTTEELAKYGARFATVNLPQGPTDVLVTKLSDDDPGHVIVGVRSEHGVHLMIMEKSIYEYGEGGNGNPNTSLEDYYTSLTPNDSDYPNYQGTKKNTYVSFIETTDNSVYTSRAGEVKSAVQSFDSSYDYRLFEYILGLEGTKVSINDSDLKTAISDYISRTRDNSNANAYNTLNEAWRTYTELVALQFDNRNTWTDVKTTSEAFRTIHPRCAVGFKSHDASEDSAWAKGGVCYNEK